MVGGADGSFSIVRLGERSKGGVGSTTGCFGSHSGEGPELGDGDGGGG